MTTAAARHGIRLGSADQVILHPTAIRSLNMRMLLDVLRLRGPLARVELAAATGISPATVTKQVADLMAIGLLAERPHTPRDEFSPGRPRVPIDFAPGSRAVLGLHLSSHGLSAAAVDLRLGILARASVSITDANETSVLRHGSGLLRRLRSKIPPSYRVLGLGVSSDGFGNVGEQLAQWAELSSVCDSTVGAAALLAQSASGSLGASVVHIALGSRVEVALILGGRRYVGSHGRAGSVQHWPLSGVHGPRCSCGQTNCLATICGDDSLVRAAIDAGILKQTGTFDQLVERAADPRLSQSRRAAHLVRIRSRRILEAATILSDFVGADVVHLSHGGRRWEGFEREFRETISEAEAGPGDRVRLIPTGARDEARAAAALFLDAFFEDPFHYEPTAQHARTR